MWNILRTLKIRYLKKRQHKIKQNNTQATQLENEQSHDEKSLRIRKSLSLPGAQRLPFPRLTVWEAWGIRFLCYIVVICYTEKETIHQELSLSLESAHHLSHPPGRNLEPGKAVRKDFYKDLRDSEPRNRVMTLTCKIKTNLILCTLPLPSFHYKLRGGKRLFSSITLAPLMKDVLGNWNIIKVILYFFY